MIKRARISQKSHFSSKTAIFPVFQVSIDIVKFIIQYQGEHYVPTKSIFHCLSVLIFSSESISDRSKINYDETKFILSGQKSIMFQQNRFWTV